MLKFELADTRNSFLRLALVGGPKHGKTYSALLLAHYLCKRYGYEKPKIALADSEHGSASKYAGRNNWSFFVCNLPDHHPVRYTEALEMMVKSGVHVGIFDSVSHAWMGTNGVLELQTDEHERMAQEAARRRTTLNDFSTWKLPKREHSKMINELISSPIHLICTFRSKMEMVKTEDDRGRSVIQRVPTGIASEKDIEYDFDIVLELDENHRVTVRRSRFPELNEKKSSNDELTESFLDPVIDWLLKTKGDNNE